MNFMNNDYLYTWIENWNLVGQVGLGSSSDKIFLFISLSLKDLVSYYTVNLGLNHNTCE